MKWKKSMIFRKERERGRFYRRKAKLNLPIYLDPEALSFAESIAEKKKTDISTVVNDLIKTDMKIAEYIE